MPVESTELVLGRGEVFFDRFQPNAETGRGERYLGNSTTFQISREIERLPVKRSYRGRLHEARGAVIAETIEVATVTDHINLQNLMDWYGDPYLGTATYGADFRQFTSIFQVWRNRYYPLSQDGFSNFYVQNATFSIGQTQLVADQDFEFDTVRGRVRILPNAPRVSDGDTVVATYYQLPTAAHVVAPDAQDVFGALRFVSQNVEGQPTDYWFPMVRMSPQGAIDLKGDEWQQMRFNATALRKRSDQPLLYISRPGTGARPITADTTLITADTTLTTADNGPWSFS